MKTTHISPNYFYGFLLAFIGVVFFSAKAVLIKLAYQYPIDHLSLLLLRMLMALPFYIAIALSTTRNLKMQLTSRHWIWLIGLGFLGYYLASLFDFIGLLYIKASLERLILFAYPTLVLIFSWAFLRKKISRNQIVAIAITYLGLIIAFYKDLGFGQEELIIGAFFVGLSAICYAAYLVGSDWLIPKFGATIFTSYAMIVSCVCIITHYLLTHEINILGYPDQVYYLALVMAIFCTVLPSYLVSWAIKSIGAPNFSIVGSFGPISTIILAYFFLEESVSWLQGIGTMVVIVGVLLASKKK